MGKKRGEKRSAPPPPPPAASSEETHSGAHESEDEETIAVSRTPAPKNPPPPPQKGKESEASDEDEEEEEEEPSHAAPTTAPKKDPPAARQSEDSDNSNDDEDGGSGSDKDAPPPKPSVKQQAKGPEVKVPRLAFHRVWSTNDEVRILKALAAHQKEHGVLPQPDALVEALAGKLDNRAYSSKELQGKVKSLKHRYVSAAKKYELPTKEHDRRLFDLSKTVWARDKSMARAATAPTAGATAKANNHEPKGFDEMCELYPYLAEEVRKLGAPGMFKREFGKMDDDKARLLDEKIKKQRVAQMKVELHRSDLAREVTKAVMDLID
ncbi:nucleolar protein dao-5-like [Hordeum vulgare subsp. vulgare]|uniref:Glabrous enhancer-binding protein-like DBD domain-containing protein n=1 Tax=Hordeum vulgare subsp. vulgare TaxID=112509 RepID=A0A8I6YLM8_HORVV|nr:nucleolar protein dao-5-like [Hordeum vulgare subsp. vulgare]